MVSSVAVKAAHDAERVVLFLDKLGVRAELRLPERFLLHLGASLRLLVWEAQGFFFNRQAGLPAAREVIRDAFLSLNDAAADPTELCVAVLRLSVERFAWSGWCDLEARVAVDDAMRMEARLREAGLALVFMDRVLPPSRAASAIWESRSSP